MEKFLKEIDDEMQNLDQLKYILQLFRLWFACKRNGLNTLSPNDLKSIEKRIMDVSDEVKAKYPELMEIIDNYYNLLQQPRYDLIDYFEKIYEKK